MRSSVFEPISLVFSSLVAQFQSNCPSLSYKDKSALDFPEEILPRPGTNLLATFNPIAAPVDKSLADSTLPITTASTPKHSRRQRKL